MGRVAWSKSGLKSPDSIMMNNSVDKVRDYWNSHLNCTQFIGNKDVSIGSDEFYSLLADYIVERHGYKDELLEEFARGCEGKKLLEVGCGLGVELVRLGKLGFDVTGIDLAPKAVELAGSYLKRLKVNGRAMVQNVERLDFPGESFDAVYSSGVIQHTLDIRKAISEMIRVLRPGGKMLIILYHRHSWFFLLHKLTGVNIEFDDKDAPIINAYTRKELKLLFAGLSDINISCEYCYPKRTKRSGMLAMLYNYIFVPGAKIIPSVIMKKLGWHLVLTGVK